MQDAAVLIGIK